MSPNVLLVLKINKQYPGIVWYEIKGFYLFSLAVKHLQEKVCNLLYQMLGHKAYVVADRQNGENSLHYAGKLAPPHHLNTVTGAPLQMQRELQWFKGSEVESSSSERTADERMSKTVELECSSLNQELQDMEVRNRRGQKKVS